jgi:hypothetical protein
LEAQLKKIGILVLAGCALISLSEARAGALTPDEIERAVFLSMVLSQDYEESLLGARILDQRFPFDDPVCDVIAERLLKEPSPQSGDALDAIVWYVASLSRYCNTARYRDALALARQRQTHDKIVEYLDVPLATPPTGSVEQYAEGGVDLLLREAQIQQQLKALRSSGVSARGVGQGASFGEVVLRAGMPQDLSSLNLRIARFGRPSVLGAHYAGVGVLIFRRSEGNRWLLVDTLEELYPVADKYKDKHFGIAQSLACLRGATFRVYVRAHAREIRRDADLAWALADRLSRVPLPADREEEDGMLVAVKFLVTSRHPDTLAMLKQIGAAPGGKVSELARDYALKIEREAPTREARRLKAEKSEAENRDAAAE